MLYRLLSFVCALAILAGCGRENSPLASSEMGEDQEEVVAKLVVSEPAAGTCEKCGGLKLIRNTALADASQNNPTSVEGATNVRIASAALVATGNTEGYRVSIITLQSDITVKGIFGQYFRNLKLVDGSTGTQLGETIGTLDGDGPFEFHLSPAMEVISGQYKILDVYADIVSAESLRPWLSVATDPDGVVAFLPVQGIGVRTGRVVTSNALKGLQRVFIATQGSLTIARSPASPAQQFAQVGDEVIADIYTVSASVAEEIDLTEWHAMVIVKDENGRVIESHASVGEVRLYKDAVAQANLISSTWVVEAEQGFSGRAPFIFPHQPFSVAQGTSRSTILTFKVWENAVPGTRVQFALYPRHSEGFWPSIVARGAASASSLVVSNTTILSAPLLSNEITIVE